MSILFQIIALHAKISKKTIEELTRNHDLFDSPFKLFLVFKNMFESCYNVLFVLLAQEQNILLQDLTIKSSTLEDVFLTLTTKDIRDGA